MIIDLNAQCCILHLQNHLLCLNFILQDSIELVHKQSKAVAVTSMSFPLGDINNFVVGSEEGSVYTACRLGRYGECTCEANLL